MEELRKTNGVHIYGKLVRTSSAYIWLYVFYPYEGAQTMQASKRMAEEAPSSSRLELLLLNLQTFPLLHCICFCNCCCGCCRFPFMASSTLDTISSCFSRDLFEKLTIGMWNFCVDI